MVIGGAFSGIASAGWLSAEFDEVIVLERDLVADTEADAHRLLLGLSASVQVGRPTPAAKSLRWLQESIA